MTSTLQALRTAAISGAVLLYATSAAPQSAATPQQHDHEHKAEAAAAAKATETTAERIAALDRRIQMLSTDMRMFTGEMKVEAMASLISTMLERQALVENQMQGTRDSMMMRDRMTHRMPMHSESGPIAEEPESGSMCAPSN